MADDAASSSNSDPATHAGRVFRRWLRERGIGEKEVDPLLVAPLVAGFVLRLLEEQLRGDDPAPDLDVDLRELTDRWSGDRAASVDWSRQAVREDAVSVLPLAGDIPARLWEDEDLFPRLEAVREPGEPRQSLPAYPLWLARAGPPLAEALVAAACIVDAPFRGNAAVEGHQRRLALFSDADTASFARAVLASYAHVRGARDWGSAFRAGGRAWREAPPELRDRAASAVEAGGDGGVSRS